MTRSPADSNALRALLLCNFKTVGVGTHIGVDGEHV